MNVIFSLIFLLFSMLHAMAAVSIDVDAFGKSLGGWKKRDRGPAEYPHSGAVYRTYKPEISPTPDGGIFISIRIDHVRGWLSSDDHAVLEITVNPKGAVVSAQSNIAIQGRSISSDVIQGANQAGQALTTPDLAVQIGTELVADLSAKLLREKIVEAGRVSFPAVLRHNFNRLFQAIRVEEVPVTPAGLAVEPPPAPAAEPAAPITPAALPAESQKTKEEPPAVPLQIKPYGAPPASVPLPGT
jgi:hypothetical protein